MEEELMKKLTMNRHLLWKAEEVKKERGQS